MLHLLPKTVMKIHVSVTLVGTVNVCALVLQPMHTSAVRKECRSTGDHPLSAVSTLLRASLGGDVLKRAIELLSYETKVMTLMETGLIYRYCFELIWHYYSFNNHNLQHIKRIYKKENLMQVFYGAWALSSQHLICKLHTILELQFFYTCENFQF